MSSDNQTEPHSGIPSVAKAGDTNQRPSTLENKIDPKDITLVLGGMLAISAGATLLLYNFINTYYIFSLDAIPLLYLLYSLSVIISLNILLFFSVQLCQLTKITVSKNIPRLMDYAYSGIMCIGLAQVLYMAPDLATYYLSQLGPEEIDVQAIRTEAETLANGRCTKLPDEYLTDDFCAKMRSIATAPTDGFKQFLMSTILPDREFLHHIVNSVTVKNNQNVEFMPRLQ